VSQLETERKTIFLVDDNMTNLKAGKEMLKDEYKVYPVPSAEIMFDLLENVTPDLILLDIEMPEMNGYQAIKELKKEPATQDIPVIFLTSKTDEGSELEGLSLGAIDYVAKPFSAPLLIKRIANHLQNEARRQQLIEFNDNLGEMVNRKTAQILNLQNAVLTTVADLVEYRDGETGGHVSRTQIYLQLLLDKLLEKGLYAEEMASWDMEYLIPSAQLHDVGKIAISDAILNKPGKLTPEEFEIMKKHAAFGEEAIESIMKLTKKNDFLLHAKIFAGTHHEKWDGTGYPRGLKGMEIPLQGRLMAIADVYDALIARRPYKPPMEAAEAEEIIIKGAGTHFDPLLVEVFTDLAPAFARTADLCNQTLQTGGTAA
jgi:putative two-component system response regulator